MNRVGLTASLVEREPIRYTPAGVPIVGLKLSHRSVQREAGTDRAVEMEISGIAADRIALSIDRIALGSALKLEGFLAPRRRNVKALVLHVTDFELDTTVERHA